MALPRTDTSLRRQLGVAAVAAVVVGDMLGSGVFFTPGELASVAERSWQVYVFWALCGGITLCGALTLAELATLLPRPGASYHIIREAWGPFWAFLKVWMEMWVSGPGSVAGVAIVFGEFLTRFLGSTWSWSAPLAGAAATWLFAAINLAGIRWGGRTQILLTTAKVLGIIGLIFGSVLVADAVPSHELATGGPVASDITSFVRLVGLGVAAVLFTYDGWIDVTHVAGEVVDPARNLPRGLGLGVGGITLLYLIVNYAYLRVVPLEAMRQAPTTVAASVAVGAFGSNGGHILNALMLVSIFGALGGLVMTLPRLYFAAARQYEHQSRGRGLHCFFRTLSTVSGRAVPVGSIVFCAVMSTCALFFFGTFSRIVNSFVVPAHFANILMVSAIFRLRPRSGAGSGYRTPGYPIVPLVYTVVIGLFLLSALFYRPLDTLVGVTLTATGIPAYLWITRGR